MKKISLNDPETQSADIVSGNIEALKTLFPEAFTEGGVDFQVLKQFLGDAVDELDEKYGLNWHGKRRARQLALTPSTGTLRPCPEESVAWDTTQNLMIEGDNLEVLKLLQKSYAGKVKLIYIDPPYNKGKDFVYPDNYKDNIRNYLELTGQIEGGQKLSSNVESSGRFHTNWLTMIYPRLRLARNLLREDGAIFISIDDVEAPNLRKILDEIFGEENFVAQVVWEKMYTTKNDSAQFSQSHEYVLVYVKDAQAESLGLLPRTDEMDARYTNPDDDPRGVWKAIPLYAKGERKNGRYAVTSPKTGKQHWPETDSHWLYVEADVKKLIADNRIYFGKDGNAKPNVKRFLTEVQQGAKVKTLWKHSEVGSNDSAKRDMRELYGDSQVPFDFPKPIPLIKRMLLLATASDDNCIVLDFFAGSGTTAQAVFEQNCADNGAREFILVQLPEPLDIDKKEQKVAAAYCEKIGKPHNIAELTKDRIKKAAEYVRSNNPLFQGDLGFRVFKLDSSNIRTWEPKRDDLPQTLLNAAEHLKADRKERDVLYELLLKLGLDLTVPIEQKKIDGKLVHSIGAGSLIICLAEKISREEVERLAQGIVAWQKALAPSGDTTAVFRDSAFVDDVAKTNLSAILQQHGIDNVRSL